ncbi:MAG TPA: class I SAM-dependent methyltransferase [Polyangiaceae bacterium]|nr:class I SAM-dependent methyltransferase [Polyangiaceae bacterium]
MSTLRKPEFQNLIQRLFAEAEASDLRLRQELAQSEAVRAEWQQLAHSDYRAAYARLNHAFLAVSPDTAKLLYMLARARGARNIVEFGTSFGLSTLHLAAAIQDNGGGVLIGSEFEAEKAAVARANLRAVGLERLVEVREGDALDTLARDLPIAIDFVLLDGAKVLYPKILELLEPNLAPGALVIADNADASPEYLARVRDAGSDYLSVPFGPDVEVSQYLPHGH